MILISSTLSEIEVQEESISGTSYTNASLRAHYWTLRAKKGHNMFLSGIESL